MKYTMLLSAGLLMSFLSCYAQDPIPEEWTPVQDIETPENLNNIKYVTFQSEATSAPEDNVRHLKESEDFNKPLTPSYLNVYKHDGSAAAGWFLSVSGGVSAFVGKPLGCEDLYGRLQPALKVDFGKWVIPSFCVRLQYQVRSLKNGELRKQKYDAAHIDLLWDLLANGHSLDKEPRFSFIPFLGCGVIQNKDADTHPFSLHYGLQGSIRMSNHLDLILEAGGINTFADFDGKGSSHHLGDQLLNVSIGFSYKFRSKYSGRKVIDAIPYIEQNEELLASLKQSRTENHLLSNNLEQKERVLNEFKKIIEIKGRLAQAFQIAESDKPYSSSNYPYNNYRGLNSLRRRLNTQYVPTESDGLALVRDSIPTIPCQAQSDTVMVLPSATQIGRTHEDDGYLALINGNKVCIGAPILFFFKLNSAQLTDQSQIANIKEIAEIVNDYNLKVTVSGSADSATGCDSINDRLSSIRADYIISEFVNMGVTSTSIKKEVLGGISQFTPIEANRNTSVRLYL